MKPNIYFVIGVNGVGKSSVLSILKSNFSNQSFAIHDLDERGVPNNVDKEWRQSEALYWAQIGKENLAKGISTIVCGFIKPSEIKLVEGQVGVQILTCLLDADAGSIRTRLMKRYSDPENLKELSRIIGETPEKFIEGNIWVSEQFRKDAEEAGYYNVDTSHLTPEQAAQEIESWVCR